jgi:hypothetical protein
MLDMYEKKMKKVKKKIDEIKKKKIRMVEKMKDENRRFKDVKK